MGGEALWGGLAAEPLLQATPPSQDGIQLPATAAHQVAPSHPGPPASSVPSSPQPTPLLINPPQGGTSSAPSPRVLAGVEPAEEHYLFALGLYSRGDWALAAREFQSFLRQYPQHPNAGRANFLLAEALLQLGQYEDAQARFSEYLRQEPEGLWAAKALFRSGEAAFLAGKTEQASSLLKAFLGRYPTDPLGAYSLVYLGQLARKGNDWGAASEYFRQCLERFPQSSLQAECQLGLAQSLEAQGKAEEALRLYQMAVQKDSGPLGAEAQFRLAALLYNLQRYAEAAGAFQWYERRFPQTGQTAYARLYRGFALFHLKNWEEARQCFAGLAGLGSEPASAATNLLQNPFRSTLPGTPSLDPSRPSSPSPGGQGGVSVLGSLPPKELQQLRRQAQYWLGMVQREQGQWTESAKTFTQLAQTASEPAEQVECHFYAADAWLHAQDAQAAVKQFDFALQAIAQQQSLEKVPLEQALSGAQPPPPTHPEKSPPVQPGSPSGGISSQHQASQWLDKILRGKLEAAVLLGDHRTADQTAKEFFQRCPESPLGADVARWQGQSLIQRKQVQEAIQVLQPWLEKAPSQELAWHIRYLLAYAYQATGQLQEAQAQLTPLLESDSGRWKALAQLAQASLLLAQKHYEQAAALLESYLAAGPNQPERPTAQAQLALCYARLRQTHKAQTIYKELAQKHSAAEWFGSWREQLAEAALEAADFAWASSLFEQLAAQADPAAAQRALLGLGWTQYRAGQFPEASATLARLLAAENLPPALAAEAAFLRGAILAKLRQPDAALGLLEMVVDKYQDSKWFGPALLAAGRLQAQLGQHSQAAQRFQRYVERFPKADDLDAALYDWAWSLKQLGQSEEARKLFERIHQEFPKSPYWAETTLRLAQEAYQALQYERAGQLVSASLANCPADLRPYGLYLQIQIAAAEQKWDLLGQLAQQLLQEHPGSPLQVYAEFWQVELAFRKKDLSAAAKLLEEFNKKYPSLPAGLAPLAALRRAQLLAHQRRWEEVIQAAQHIREQYPQFDQLYEADYLLGRALAMKARFDEAREAFQRVVRSPQGAKTETAAMAQWYIGETYFHQRDYQTALRAYLLVEVLYGYPEWQALALLEAARCRQKLGQPEEAQKLYGRLLAEFPNTAAAQQYRRTAAGSGEQPIAPYSQPTSTPDSSEPQNLPSDSSSSRLDKKTSQSPRLPAGERLTSVIGQACNYIHIAFPRQVSLREKAGSEQFAIDRLQLPFSRFPSVFCEGHGVL